MSKHLRVLEHAGLLVQTKDGRVRLCRLVAAPLRDADEWLADYRSFWELRLGALADHFQQKGA